MTEQEFEDAFKGQMPALIRMTETDGFKLFMKWVEFQVGNFETKVLAADTTEDWIEARANYTSYKNMLSMPSIFAEKIKALDSEVFPPDYPEQ